MRTKLKEPAEKIMEKSGAAGVEMSVASLVEVREQQMINRDGSLVLDRIQTHALAE